MFKERSPAGILFIFALALLVKMPLFLFPKVIVATVNDEDIYHFLVSAINTTGDSKAFIASFIAFSLLLIQALLINYLMNEYRMNTKQTYLPAMAYLLITSLLPEWSFLSSPLVANTLIIWTFIKLFKLYNTTESNAAVFNTGLIIGLCSYIYFPSATFGICFLFGLLILKPFRLNEIVLFLIGIVTPYYFYGGYLFLIDKLNIPNFVPHISVRVPEIKSSIYLAIATLVLGIPFLVGGFFIQANLHRMLIQVRKNWSIFLLYILFAFFVPFINSYTSFNNWVLIAAPFAAFHTAAYYYPAKKFLPIFLFVTSTGFILFQQYGTMLWRQ